METALLTRGDRILAALLTTPNSQIDTSIILKLEKLQAATRPLKPEALKSILDECAHGSPASNFAMFAMHELWKQFLKEQEL